ncbi:MAG: class I SAM-dependent methyltransferase [Anaerolineae bacterium]|nr:class I SAM-dependent methyltransferase [Anaerolineae bacterium]
MKSRSTCRVCNSALEPILDLGNHFVSDFPKPNDPPGSKAPLELVLCRRCRLLQLKHTVDPDEMYRNYWYRSGTNQTMRTALADVANKAETLIGLKENEAVLDIGCNDGTLLAAYRTGGIYKVGIDPSNVAHASSKIADKLIIDFFSAEVFQRELGERHAKIITSIAMFYDLENPNKFVSDIKRVMDLDGLWIIQMSYLPLMLKTNEFGNICHEHLAYYSLQSLEYLLHLHGFEIVDVELNEINGGSLRAYIRNRGANAEAFGDATYRAFAAERVSKMREDEIKLGLGDKPAYQEFAHRVERIKNDTVNFIREQTAAGKRVFVYGASTKGNTVLQYFGLDHTLIAAAAERNADKWGRVTVGTHIPIVSEADARAAKPDYFLVLPWHFLEEFMAREHDYLYSGGRFVVPFPYFTLI